MFRWLEAGIEYISGMFRRGDEKTLVINPDASRLTRRQREAIGRILNREGFEIVSTPALANLENAANRTQEVEAENVELRQRPTVAEHKALQARLESSETTRERLEAELAGLRPLKEQLSQLSTKNEQLERRLRPRERRIEQLQQELTNTKEESRRRGGIIQDVFQRYLSLYKRIMQDNPPEGRVVAICARDAHSIVASAPLMRSRIGGIGYPVQESWYELLPQLKIKESRNRTPREQPDTREVITREVIIIGFYPDSEQARRHMESLYTNGVRVVVITDRKDVQVPAFVIVHQGSSLARAVSKYLETKGFHDEVIEKLAVLGDACKNGSTEEAGYLMDSLYDPTNTGFIKGVLTPLSERGTVIDTPIYRGVRRRAEDYRSLKSDGFRI